MWVLNSMRKILNKWEKNKANHKLVSLKCFQILTAFQRRRAIQLDIGYPAIISGPYSENVNAGLKPNPMNSEKPSEWRFIKKGNVNDLVSPSFKSPYKILRSQNQFPYGNLQHSSANKFFPRRRKTIAKIFFQGHLFNHSIWRSPCWISVNHVVGILLRLSMNWRHKLSFALYAFLISWINLLSDMKKNTLSLNPHWGQPNSFPDLVSFQAENTILKHKLQDRLAILRSWQGYRHWLLHCYTSSPPADVQWNSFFRQVI